MPDTTESICAQVARTRPRSPTQGFPAEVRARVGAWARAQREAGVSFESMATLLRVNPSTVREWAQRASTSTFLPVQIEAEPCHAPTAPPTLVSPRGYRVEGLDLAQLVSLLERLG